MGILFRTTQIELETERDDLETLCAGATLRNSKKLGAWFEECRFNY